MRKLRPDPYLPEKFILFALIKTLKNDEKYLLYILSNIRKKRQPDNEIWLVNRM